MIKLLLVEDNSTLRYLMANFISGSKCIEVIETAENGQIAFDRLCEGLHVDVVLTDLSMPIMNGIELTRKIREEEFCVNILIMTAHADRVSFNNAFAAGANGYLLKDDFEQLLEAISQIHAGETIYSKEMEQFIM